MSEATDRERARELEQAILRLVWVDIPDANGHMVAWIRKKEVLAALRREAGGK